MASDKGATIDTNTKSILIVDDEFDIVHIISDLLIKRGFYVSAFTEPLKVLEHLQRNYKIYCLILSDVRMPRMSI